MQRGPFAEALTWLEIHGRAPEIVEHWRGFLEAAGPVEGVPAGEPLGLAPPRRRRRGRRRRYTDRPKSHCWMCGVSVRSVPAGV
jgi:hypothetical protein